MDTTDYNAAKLRLPPGLADLRGAKNASEAGSLGSAIKVEVYCEDPAVKATTRHD